MNKFSTFLILILVFALGIMTSLYITERNNNLNNTNIETSAEPVADVTGTYYNTDWNGKSATLVLRKDGTCSYPTGSSGTWKQIEDYIEIDIDSIHKAYIMKNGIMLHDHFFEKMD